MKKDGRVTFGYRTYESIEEASKHLRVPVGMLYAKLSAIEKRKAEDLKQRTGISFGEAMGLANAKPFYDEDLITTLTVGDDDWIDNMELDFEEIILAEDEIIIFNADPGFFDKNTKDSDWGETGEGSKKTAPKSLTQTFENIDDHRLGALSKAEGYGD